MARSIRNRGSVPVADIASGEIVRRGRPIRITGEFGERDAHAVEVTGGGGRRRRRSRATRWSSTPRGSRSAATRSSSTGIPARGKQKGRQDAAFDVVVVDTPAALDEGLVVLHASRIRIGELDIESLPMGAGAEGAFRDVFKAVTRDGEKAVTLAFDQVGERVDIDEELAALATRRQDRYGRIEPALFEQLEHGGDVDVAVWASTRGIDLPTPEKSDRRPARKPSRTDVRDAEGVGRRSARSSPRSHGSSGSSPSASTRRRRSSTGASPADARPLARSAGLRRGRLPP